jgi:5-methylcytosine-specific restriction endonuclease McrA
VELKTCRKCKTEKPLTEFYKKRSAKDGHQGACKLCDNAKSKAWREANKKKIDAKNKAYREANREKLNAESKAYRETNREKVKAQNKAYYEVNREKIKAYRKTPRARFLRMRDGAKRRGIEFLLTEEQAVEMIKKPCTYCGKPKSSGIDRIDSNGIYTIENCEPCCWTCNSRKGTKSKEVFLQEIKEGKWN